MRRRGRAPDPAREHLLFAPRVVLALVVAAACILPVAGHLAFRLLPSVHPAFPELDLVSPEVVERAKTLLGDPRLRPCWGVRDKGRAELDVWAEEYAAFLRSAPREAALAVIRCRLEAILDQSYVVTEYWDAAMDSLTSREAVLLGEVSAVQVEDVLLRLLEPEYRIAPVPFEAQRLAAIALCRPTCADSLPALAACAMSRSLGDATRRELLYRLHRLGCPLPLRMHSLLYEAFGDLDLVAAGTLARTGDGAGAPLIARGMKRVAADWPLSHHLAEGTRRLTGTAETWPRGLSGVPRAKGESEDEMWRRAERLRLLPFEVALRQWLEARRADPDPEWATLDYAAAPRHAFEHRITSFEELLAAGDDFDFAAAALLLTESDAERRENALDRLNRLAHLARLRCMPEPTAWRQFAALDDFLPGPRTAWDGSPEVATSFLPRVLEHREANCLGSASLGLALAERLDLPVRAVRAPRHVYLRWDDGESRLDLETTSGWIGETAEREDPAAIREACPRLVAEGCYLEPLTRRQALGLVLVNEASRRLDRRDFERAETAARRGLELLPDDPTLLFLLVCSVHRGAADRDDEVREFAERLLARPWSESGEDLGPVLVQVLLEARAVDLARRFADGIEDGSGTTGLGSALPWRVLVALRSGETAEAEALLAGCPEDGRSGSGWLLGRALVDVTAHPERALGLLAGLCEGGPVEVNGLVSVFLDHLLDGGIRIEKAQARRLAELLEPESAMRAQTPFEAAVTQRARAANLLAARLYVRALLPLQADWSLDVARKLGAAGRDLQVAEAELADAMR